MRTKTKTNKRDLQYYDAGRRAGCPPDQTACFLAAGYIAQPRQWLFHAACRACDEPDGPTQVGFGGARGGAKSHAMLCQIALDDCQRQPGLKALLLRKVGKAAKEGFEDLRAKILRTTKHEWRRDEGILTFPNGSRIVLGHFKDESDIDAYLGLEYDVIGVEEATTLTYTKYRAIRTCNRTSKPGWRPRIYTTTNPGGVGHAWYKATFIRPYQAARETPSLRSGAGADTRFIPSTVDDNRFVNREYTATLDGLTGWQKRAWRYGDWDISAGQFFTTFRADIHAVTPFPIPPHWPVWLAMDYGFTHYNVILLFAQDGDGRVYVAGELAEQRWLVPRHAQALDSMLARQGIDPGPAVVLYGRARRVRRAPERPGIDRRPVGRRGLDPGPGQRRPDQRRGRGAPAAGGCRGKHPAHPVHLSHLRPAPGVPAGPRARPPPPRGCAEGGHRRRGLRRRRPLRRAALRADGLSREPHDRQHRREVGSMAGMRRFWILDFGFWPPETGGTGILD